MILLSGRQKGFKEYKMLTQIKTQTITGSKVILETLKSLGVDTIFGYPGGIVLDLYDELSKQSDIKHVLVRHEQSAVHAAEGYARTTDKCGIVLVTSGPGATNTVTGIANAYIDGYPLIILTGQVYKNLIGTDAFQEANICNIVKSCTKKVFQVTDAKDLHSIISYAHTIATSGKKGPVLIDITKDCFSQTVEYQPKKNIDIEFNHNSNKSIKSVLDKLLTSTKPVIVCGGGVYHSKAHTQLYNFAKSMKIPVVATMMGVGAYPQDDMNYLGMIGIFGDNSANNVIKESDLVLSLGARFNDRITCMFSRSDLRTKFIQIDINKDEIGRVITPIDFIAEDIKFVLDEFNKNVRKTDKFAHWLEKTQQYRILNPVLEKKTNMLHSFELIKELEDFTKNKEVIFTSEVGQHQLWAVKNLSFNPKRRILLSGGSGTMGFGLPAAIGASIANPDKTVVCIAGDGSFQMNLHELATCKENNLNVKIIILDNGYLGMVRQLQEKNCDGRYYQTKIFNPDIVTLAKSYGIEAKEINSILDVKQALEEAFTYNGTFIINFRVEPFEVI